MVKWRKLNTAFFHRFILANLSRNIIYFLLDSRNQRIPDSFLMKSMALNYYQNLLGTESLVTASPLTLDQTKEIHSFKCDPAQVSSLSTFTSDEEIKAVVFSLPHNKAPCPNGFTSEFFVDSWNLVGKDLIDTVQYFFNTGNLSRQVNATVIYLIPKVCAAVSLNFAQYPYVTLSTRLFLNCCRPT